MYRLFKQIATTLSSGIVFAWSEIEANTNLYVVMLVAEGTYCQKFKIEHPQFKRYLIGYKIGDDICWKLERSGPKPLIKK